MLHLQARMQDRLNETTQMSENTITEVKQFNQTLEHTLTNSQYELEMSRRNFDQTLADKNRLAKKYETLSRGKTKANDRKT